MSRERRLNIQPTALPDSTDTELSTVEHFGSCEQHDSLNPSENQESTLSLPDYIAAQDPNLHPTARSVFEAKTPGAMALEEVERNIELGKWRLKLQRMGRTVTLQVSNALSLPLLSLSNPSPIRALLS